MFDGESDLAYKHGSEIWALLQKFGDQKHQILGAISENFKT